MAKKTGYEKAWQRYIELYDSPRKKGGGSRKASRAASRQRQLHTAYYDKLVEFAASEGIKVSMMNEAEATRKFDANGHSFIAAGWFSPPSTIKMKYRLLSTLIHEVAHALDYRLGWGHTSAEKECVAIGVAYLVMVSLDGYSRARPNIGYAGVNQVTVEQVLAQRERIEFIHDIIIDALKTTSPQEEKEIAAFV